MACRKRDVEERGRPPKLLHGQGDGVRDTAPEARQGKPGDRTLREPTRRGETQGREAEASCQRASSLHASGASYHAAYAEVGKAHSRGKDVTEGRSPHRKRLPDTVGPDPHAPTSLRGRANKARAAKRHRCRDLSRCVEANLLRTCGDDLNQAAARGVDQGTAEDEAAHLQANMEAWAQRLQAQRYRATWVRRGDRPKAHGKERP